MTYEEEMKLAYKNLAVAALEAQTAVLLHALKQAEPILDAASATAREDGGTMIPGARPAWDAVRAAIALERFPVSRSQNIIVIGSGHLLSILAENARLEQQVVELAEAKAILPNLLKYLGMMIRWADLTVVPALGEGALPRCIDRARAVLDAARAALPVPPLPIDEWARGPKLDKDGPQV